jgi:hypothetical protein
MLARNSVHGGDAVTRSPPALVQRANVLTSDKVATMFVLTS